MLVLIASIVEVTSCGDDPDYDKEILAELSKFKSSTQYETVTIQRKKPWARWLISLSIVRNCNKLNMDPYAVRKAADSEDYNQEYLQNMKIFSGVKAIAILYIMLAVSFIFIWYSYISDPLRI